MHSYRFKNSTVHQTKEARTRKKELTVSHNPAQPDGSIFGANAGSVWMQINKIAQLPEVDGLHHHYERLAA
jgi:hypothetical protein